MSAMKYNLCVAFTLKGDFEKANSLLQEVRAGIMKELPWKRLISHSGLVLKCLVIILSQALMFKKNIKELKYLRFIRQNSS